MLFGRNTVREQREGMAVREVAERATPPDTIDELERLDHGADYEMERRVLRERGAPAWRELLGY